MIPLTASTPITLAREPADFRAGIDGFVARCRDQLHQDPRSGRLFVFINRAQTMIRILAYDHNGYVLLTKRLSCGRFQGWPRAGEPISELQAVALRRLLSGSLS